MSTMNYPAFFVTIATVFLLIVHTIAPSAMLALASVILVPLAITACVFIYLEGHRNQEQ